MKSSGWGSAGHGHRELFFSLFGAEKMIAGTVEVGGKAVRIRNPREAMRHGIALVPEDRKTEGLLLAMSVRDNATLAVLRRLARFSILRHVRGRQLAQGLIDRLRVRTPGLSNPVGALSGGNQQKVLLGRWLLAEPNIFLLYDVTRGVDVATKHEIYELIMRLAKEGRAIMLISPTPRNCAHLSHRVLVMREGRIAAELSGAELDAEIIVSAAVRDRIAT